MWALCFSVFSGNCAERLTFSGFCDKIYLFVTWLQYFFLKYDKIRM